MNAGTIVLLAIIVALASAGAIVAGADVAVEVPAAAIAVGAAALLLVGVLDRAVWPSTRARALPRPSSTRVRAAFAAGRHGRRELIAYLDSIERGGFGLATPVLSSEELNRLLTGTAEEFRQYLDTRLRNLERRT
jgi:hypothetical protein